MNEYRDHVAAQMSVKRMRFLTLEGCTNNFPEGIEVLHFHRDHGIASYANANSIPVSRETYVAICECFQHLLLEAVDVEEQIEIEYRDLYDRIRKISSHSFMDRPIVRVRIGGETSAFDRLSQAQVDRLVACNVLERCREPSRLDSGLEDVEHGLIDAVLKRAYEYSASIDFCVGVHLGEVCDMDTDVDGAGCAGGPQSRAERRWTAKSRTAQKGGTFREKSHTGMERMS